MDMTTEIRTNTDYIFALKDNIVKNRERLFVEYFGNFPSFAVFDALFLEVTQDYRCLVLDNTIPSTKIEDVVFWYKAEKRPPYRLGADWWWKYSAANVNTNEDKEDQQVLEEMTTKAVRVIMEGQQQKPPPSSNNAATIQTGLNEPRRRESKVQFGRGQQQQTHYEDNPYEYVEYQKRSDRIYNPQPSQTYHYDQSYERHHQNYERPHQNYERPQQTYDRNAYQSYERPQRSYDQNSERQVFNQEWDYGNAYPGYRPRREERNYDPQQDVRYQPQFNGHTFQEYQEAQLYGPMLHDRVQPVRAGFNRPQTTIYAPMGGFVYQ